MKKLEYDILQVYALKQAMGENFHLEPGTRINIHRDDIKESSVYEIFTWLCENGINCILDDDTYPKNSPLTIFQVEYPDKI